MPRCFQVPRHFKGKGLAHRCEAEGGLKVDYSIYIASLWEDIGYVPPRTDATFDLEEDELNQQVGGGFTPFKTVSSPSKFSGVSIKKFPDNIDHGDIIELLTGLGLPEENKDNVQVNSNGVVIIRELDNTACLNLIKNIQGKIHYSRKMYCNGIVALTPLKTNIMDVSSESKLQAESSTVVSKEIDFSEDVHAATEEFHQRPIPKTLSPLKSPTWPSCNVRDLARRHSLSLLDGTPPSNSLAEELLNFHN